MRRTSDCLCFFFFFFSVAVVAVFIDIFLTFCMMFIQGTDTERVLVYIDDRDKLLECRSVVAVYWR